MTRVQILRDSILDHFADTVYTYREQTFKVWLVSPWLSSHSKASIDPIQLIIEALRNKTNCTVFLLTRPPRHAWHVQAVELLKSNIRPGVFYCESLHTKLYIIECDGFRSAMIGSPNLTAKANFINFELALELRTTSQDRRDDVAQTIQDLIEYAQHLLLEPDVWPAF